jgi:hypothetical protein
LNPKDESAILSPIVLPVGSKNGLVELFVTLLTFFGTIFVMVIFAKHVMYPIDKQSYEVMPIWVRGTIFYFALVLGIVIFASLAAIIDKNFISKRKLMTMKDVVNSLNKAQVSIWGKTLGKFYRILHCFARTRT